MITGDYCRYHINSDQFANLFSDNVNHEVVDILGKSAADGNLDCIDMLLNIALRHDAVGQRAEDILFDLFSGQIRGKSGIDKEIQLASLKLYELAQSARGKNNEDMKKFDSPSGLLYMAGCAMSSVKKRLDISAIFNRGDYAQSEFEQLDNAELWSDSRMLTTDDINAAMTYVIRNLSLNFPISLINPANKSNMLSELICEKIKCYMLNGIEFFPINTGGHWILFGLYHGEDDRDFRCVVFNSCRGLNLNIKRYLVDAATLSGVLNENICFIDGNMQQNVPNGCGLFVIKAMEALSHAPEKNPVNVLKKFVDDFTKRSVEEQELFNIQVRRQAYKHRIRQMCIADFTKTRAEYINGA